MVRVISDSVRQICRLPVGRGINNLACKLMMAVTVLTALTNKIDRIEDMAIPCQKMGALNEVSSLPISKCEH